MPKTILTDTAERLINSAAGTSSAVEITHVALGDGLGQTYEPSFSQTALRRELARRPIDRRYQLTPNAWRTVTEFPINTPNIMVREIGFFDGQNNLIALWAGLDVDPRQTGQIIYLIDHTLTFSRVTSGLIQVVAHDDDLFRYALARLGEDATTQSLLIKLTEKALS